MFIEGRVVTFWHCRFCDLQKLLLCMLISWPFLQIKTPNFLHIFFMLLAIGKNNQMCSVWYTFWTTITQNGLICLSDIFLGDFEWLWHKILVTKISVFKLEIFILYTTLPIEAFWHSLKCYKCYWPSPKVGRKAIWPKICIFSNKLPNGHVGS